MKFLRKIFVWWFYRKVSFSIHLYAIGHADGQKYSIISNNNNDVIWSDTAIHSIKLKFSMNGLKSTHTNMATPLIITKESIVDSTVMFNKMFDNCIPGFVTEAYPGVIIIHSDKGSKYELQN